MAEAVEGVGDLVGVAELATDLQRFPVVVDGFPVLVAVIGDVTETVQSGRFAEVVVVLAEQLQRGLAVRPGAVVVANLLRDRLPSRR